MTTNSRDTRPGGAPIVFDKTDCAGGGYLSTAIHRLTVAGKLQGGASADAILAKELSISGVQRPLPWRSLSMTAPPPFRSSGSANLQGGSSKHRDSSDSDTPSLRHRGEITASESST
jgi:hypothetical protein